MYKLRIFTIALFVGLCVGMPAQGEKSLNTTAGASQQKKLIYMDNAMCPVSDDEIEEAAQVKIEYEGRIYNLCCEACAKHFRKFPDKFSRKVKGEI